MRRALPSVVDINHNQCIIFHPSQEKSSSRCRYMEHSRQNTEVCNAYTENSDIIPIRSVNNGMSNFYQCIVILDGIDFKSSEHAYQWRLAKHVGRDDLAQCILESNTPGQAKEIASQIPRHLLGSWHADKLHVMQEILFAKAECLLKYECTILDHNKQSHGTVNVGKFMCICFGGYTIKILCMPLFCMCTQYTLIW